MASRKYLQTIFVCGCGRLPSFWRSTSSSLSRSQSALVSCAFASRLSVWMSFFAARRVFSVRSWLYLHFAPLSQRPALKKGHRTDLGSSPKASYASRPGDTRTLGAVMTALNSSLSSFSCSFFASRIFFA